jgi:hypothetical protein
MRAKMWENKVRIQRRHTRAFYDCLIPLLAYWAATTGRSPAAVSVVHDKIFVERKPASFKRL